MRSASWLSVFWSIFSTVSTSSTWSATTTTFVCNWVMGIYCTFSIKCITFCHFVMPENCFWLKTEKVFDPSKYPRIAQVASEWQGIVCSRFTTISVSEIHDCKFLLSMFRFLLHFNLFWCWFPPIRPGKSIRLVFANSRALEQKLNSMNRSGLQPY
jgi:hypothetical protein